MTGRKPRPTFSPITDLEQRAIVAIAPGFVTYPPGSPPKRFARELQTMQQLSDGQRKFLWRIVWTFRRQIRDAELVTVAEQRRGWAARDVAAPTRVTVAPTDAPTPTDEDVPLPLFEGAL